MKTTKHMQKIVRTTNACLTAIENWAERIMECALLNRDLRKRIAKNHKAHGLPVPKYFTKNIGEEARQAMIFLFDVKQVRLESKATTRVGRNGIFGIAGLALSTFQELYGVIRKEGNNPGSMAKYCEERGVESKTTAKALAACAKLEQVFRDSCDLA